MNLTHKSAVLFAFVLGVLLAFPIVLISPLYIANFSYVSVVVLAIVLFLVMIPMIIVAYFYEQITTAVFKSVNTRLESIAEPLSNAAKCFAVQDFESGSEHLKAGGKTLLAYISWTAIRRAAFTFCVSIIGAMVAMATTSLLVVQNQYIRMQVKVSERQNQFIEEQTELAKQQASLAKVQNEFAKIQTEIARQQLMPEFVFNYKNKDGEPEVGKRGSRIEVENIGEPVREFTCVALAFLDVRVQDLDIDTSLEPTNFQFPLKGFYEGILEEPSVKGIVATIVPFYSDDDSSKLADKFKSFCESIGKSGTLGIKQYVRITFKDSLGDLQLRYYLLRPGIDSRRLTPEFGEHLFSLAHEMDHDYLLELEKLTGQTICDLISKRKAEGNFGN